jgi:putative nucleotidyltransferase with HDIG domain
MSASPPSGSIFSQKLDRVSFIAYFLGAVVPLAALGFVVDRFVLPALDDGLSTAALLGSLASITVLSLASFLVLRQSTRRSLRQMDADNQRLTSLFDASGSLGRAGDAHEALAAAARGALELADASAAFVMMRKESAGPPHVEGSAGDDPLKLYSAHEEALQEVARLVLSEGSPVVRGPDAQGPALVAVAVPGEAAPMGALLAVRNHVESEFSPVDSLTTLARLAATALRNIDLRDAQRNFFTHVTDLLVTALDSHLGYHTGHSQRVAALANRLGRAMGLDEHRLQRLHFGALLHDIGMLRFDRAAKKSPLTCQKHAALGARMLNRITVWQDIAPIVHHHHEWWDGSGYPDGAAGESIPLESRIIGVCDAFDSMTSQHSYKPPISLEAALRELERSRGSQFDPGVVDVFQELAARGAIEVEAA